MGFSGLGVILHPSAGWLFHALRPAVAARASLGKAASRACPDSTSFLTARDAACPAERVQCARLPATCQSGSRGLATARAIGFCAISVRNAFGRASAWSVP